jgi:acetyl-CoA carboxylase biotin carboxyl carrier protein
VTEEDRGLIGDLEIRQIIKLVEALDKSSLDSLQLDLGHLRLTLGKGGTPVEPLSAAVSPAPDATPRAAARQPASRAAGTIDVPSPIMGLFYSKPDPGSRPFVSLGSEVHEGTTVGLIEVMKVFNAVQAGTKGVIVEICVKDAETVEMGQTLFRIRPAAT